MAMKNIKKYNGTLKLYWHISYGQKGYRSLIEVSGVMAYVSVRANDVYDIPSLEGTFVTALIGEHCGKLTLHHIEGHGHV